MSQKKHKDMKISKKEFKKKIMKESKHKKLLNFDIYNYLNEIIFKIYL